MYGWDVDMLPLALSEVNWMGMGNASDWEVIAYQDLVSGNLTIK
tara:strand:+ start:189 stop:320 length:132 start_codon:yes stop_codon:yes gene_type:complete